MLRSGGEKPRQFTVVCDPADYGAVLAALANRTDLAALRRLLALKVFQRTASYDAAIARYLETSRWSPTSRRSAGFR